MAFKANVSAVALTLMLFTSMDPGLASGAGGPQAEGTRLYNQRQYNAALAQFGSAMRSDPNNPLLHYYVALCYQGMNQMSLARQQYEWVASASRDATLRAQASAALSNLSRYKTSSGSSSGMAIGQGGPVIASAGVSHSGGSKLKGRLKVFDFYTDW